MANTTPVDKIVVKVRTPVKIKPKINTDVTTIITYENLDGGEF